VKIEFQGGEPTLRSDLLKTVMERSSALRPTEYVICTNLSEINDDLLAIMDRDDVYISTSLDGDLATHRANRTASLDRTKTFARNLDYVLQRYGPKKVSALPTVNSAAPPPADDLIDSFVSRGLTSIYLRPVTFHGFARKRHRESREQDDGWRSYYEAFVHNLIARNWADRSKVLDESYLTLCLNRVFRPGRDRHVDLRNPNPVGVDYIVIDHDGTVFPTDEARMLSRSKIVDLSIGDVHRGWDGERRRLLNAHATNQFDADCSRCAYQPYCGRDIVDDLARYGRIDLPRTETAFCRRHLHLFDLIFELIYADDEPTQYSLRRWLQLPGETATLAERLS
jgi:radical SAM protein with 4Fe4S-binding SPASM domain